MAKTALGKEDLILDVGSGTSVFVPNLLDLGYRNIVATDISEVALNKSKQKLGGKAGLVAFIVDDIAHSTKVRDLRNVALWHDRAVFHFLTKPEERQAYLETLKKVLKAGGYVIISTFSLEGPKKCSGLDVVNYDANQLAQFLGPDFILRESFNYRHPLPSGQERTFVYALFERKK